MNDYDFAEYYGKKMCILGQTRGISDFYHDIEKQPFYMELSADARNYLWNYYQLNSVIRLNKLNAGEFSE